MKTNLMNNGIPISISLNPTLENEKIKPQVNADKKRILIISGIAFMIAVAISFIAKLLVSLIDLLTNISFHGTFSINHSSPASNTLGIMVIFVPAIGGVIVGFMALYGSKAIRGHGIPEAMEQILTNQSKIKPSITYLKPLSAAISIGTGGPFGAEGPIIATGGALGSTIGQLLKISHNERKILLAAGATAGMSAIFGSPIAAIFLAIELLLFEFSPRSILPVAIACITGAAGHHLLFSSEPVFAMASFVETPGNTAILMYALIGLAIGILAVLVTKIVYLIEDNFEKIPIHWMWYPALGGLIVGTVGYFAPRTLGVGYDNITDVLSGSMPMQLILSLCLLKFVSWAVALGSGTSGGTLAPLLTIGGASGALLGSFIISFYPACGITLPLAALIGMSAMFAGASRALLTSIIFALETTSQANALLPLLTACTISYFVSFLLMKNTIMTEKIARRGVKTPHSYEADVLEKITVGEVIKENRLVLSNDNNIREVKEWFANEKEYPENYFIVVNAENEFQGIINSLDVFGHNEVNDSIGTLIKSKHSTIAVDSSLRKAVELMAEENTDVLPVVSKEDKNNVIGVLSYKDLIAAYKYNMDEHTKNNPNISIKRNRLKIVVRGQKLMNRIIK
ncbi:MAG: chloride channel protein [Bacteroidetes bacterium]|nr:chloride channel protein [Bacteroidota bacterium]